LCALRRQELAAFHGALNIFVNFVEFGFMSGNPRSSFDEKKRVNIRGNIMVCQLFE
jgi:hypothetical protein